MEQNFESANLFIFPVPNTLEEEDFHMARKVKIDGGGLERGGLGKNGLYPFKPRRLGGFKRTCVCLDGGSSQFVMFFFRPRDDFFILLVRSGP